MGDLKCPDLKGKWTSPAYKVSLLTVKSDVSVWEPTARDPMVLDVLKQEGCTFEATNTWLRPDATINTEKVIGIISILPMFENTENQYYRTGISGVRIRMTEVGSVWDSEKPTESTSGASSTNIEAHFNSDGRMMFSYLGTNHAGNFAVAFQTQLKLASGFDMAQEVSSSASHLSTSASLYLVIFLAFKKLLWR